MPLLFSIDSTSSTVTKIKLLKNKISVNIQEVSQVLLLTDFMKNIKQSMVNWTLKDFWSLFSQWKIRNHLKPFNTFGEFLMFITRVLSIHLSLTCSSVLSFKNFKLLKSVALMWRILRMKYLIWQNQNYQWPLL